MKPGTLRRRIAPRVLGLSAAAALALARGGDETGEALLRRVEARLAGVRDYTVTLEVVADIERLNVPPMRAKMYFKQPDMVHLDAEGFALLPREGLQLDVAKLLTRYTVTSVGSDTALGIRVRTVMLAAKSERTFPRAITIWINTERWTAERLITRGSADRRAAIAYLYTRVGDVWLPSEMTAEFSVAAPDSAEPEAPQGMVRPRQQPRSGRVSVRYSDYRLNTGLSDDIFRKEVPAR